MLQFQHGSRCSSQSTTEDFGLTSRVYHAKFSRSKLNDMSVDNNSPKFAPSRGYILVGGGIQNR